MIHDVASFVRWRLKPNRWAVKGLNALAELPRRAGEPEPASVPPSALIEQMKRESFAKLDRTLDLPEFDLAAYRGRAGGKSFVDIKDDHRALVMDTFVRLVGDKGTTDLVMDYFDGRPWLWNVALNYSDPSQGMTDSQLWHFDYGDTRQLHLMVYFSDVTEESGPFTFLPAQFSDRVARHPLVIERMTDEDLARRFGIDAASAATRLTGTRGDLFVNDPGRLMHQGARCTRQRLVMFVTFTSRSPMSRGGSQTIDRQERQAFGEALRKAAPDNLLPGSTFA